MAANGKRPMLGRARAWARRAMMRPGIRAAVTALGVVVIASAVALVVKILFVQVGWPSVALGYLAIPAWAAFAALFAGGPVVLFAQARDEGRVGVRKGLLLAVCTLVFWGIALFAAMGVADPLADLACLDEPATVTLRDVDVERERGARSGAHFFSVEGLSPEGEELSFTVSRELYDQLRDVDAVKVTYLPHSKVVVGLEAEALR